MPDQLISFPETYEDMQRLYEQYIGSPDLDPDAFEYSPVSEGRSYSFYGKKAFEFSEEKGRLRVWGSTMILAGLGQKDLKPDALYSLTRLTIDPDQLRSLLAAFSQQQKQIFRNTITEQFGCCNDFKACSDAGHCLHPEDRFYNGCQYRSNLEAGRIFYGKNRNV